ncbi:hypothetical protein Tco_0453763 [Tanacetum coccineum]
MDRGHYESISEGPFQMGPFIQTPAEDAEEMMRVTIQLGMLEVRTEMANVNPSQAKPIMCYNCKGIRHIATRMSKPKLVLRILLFKDKMLLMNAHENGAVLDEEQLLFLAGEHATNFDDDMCNIIPYDQYVEDNEEHVVKSNVSSVRNDALISILDEMHEQGVQSRSVSLINANDVTDLLEQNERLRAEIEKVKQHYKEMFGVFKIRRTSLWKRTSSVCRKIPPRLKKIGFAPFTYINIFKESVEKSLGRFRELDFRVVKPLDNVLNYACQYTKLSQELVEYVIGTCPKEFTERDSKAPSIPLTRKKQVTFTDTLQ